MSSELTYDELLAQARADPGGADFAALRRAYTRRPDYDPYAHDLEAREALADALGKEDHPAAFAAINALLEVFYLDLEAHMQAELLYRKSAQSEKAEYHRQFAAGLLRAIAESGDGQRYHTAFVVIHVSEIHAVLKALGLDLVGEYPVEHEGHQFEAVDYRHLQTGRTGTFLFNVDALRGWLDRRIASVAERPRRRRGPIAAVGAFIRNLARRRSPPASQ